MTKQGVRIDLRQCETAPTLDYAWSVQSIQSALNCKDLNRTQSGQKVRIVVRMCPETPYGLSFSALSAE